MEAEHGRGGHPHRICQAAVVGPPEDEHCRPAADVSPSALYHGTRWVVALEILYRKNIANGMNDAYFNLPQFDGLFERARGMPDSPERKWPRDAAETFKVTQALD